MALTSRTEAQPEYRRGQFGLTLFLVSLTVGFIGMLILYGTLRNQLPSWPPAGQPALPITWPFVNTVLVIASSAAMHQAVRSVRRGQPRAFSMWVLLTTNLGVAFLAVQVLLPRQALSLGIEAGSTLYGSLLYLLGSFHAAHLVVGVAALGYMSLTAIKQDYTPARLGAVIGRSRN